MRSSFLSLSVLLCSLAPAANSQQFVTSHRVSPNSTFGFPTGPYGVADFNSDGRLDFFTFANNSSDSNLVSALMLQNSDGTFTRRDVPSIPIGAIVVADLNGDGHADIVSAVPGPSNDHGDPLGPATLTIALGNGDGTFRVQSAINLLGDNGGTSVLVRDITGDNKPDILVFSGDQYYDSTLQTFLNNGGGTFRAGPTYGPNVIGGTLLATADFNGDGKSDVVIENNFETQILLGKGGGAFASGATYNYLPRFVGVGDLNRDHHQDLVVVTTQNSEILLGKGDGTLTPSGTLPTSFGLNSSHLGYDVVGPTSTYINDINKDGIPDIALVSGSSTAEAAIYYGKGNGTFSSPKIYNIGGAYYLDAWAPSLFADFNHDGNIDVLSLGDAAGFSIAYGDGHGGLIAPAITPCTISRLHRPRRF